MSEDNEFFMPTSLPGFSVLMSVYSKDRPEWLTLALQSVIDQTLSPSEIVLVVDGPVTPVLELTIGELQDRYPKLLKVVCLTKNVGLGLALQEGMKHVTNNLVARMDSDDISVPERFSRQIPYMAAHPEVGVLGGQIEEFDDLTNKVVGIREVPCDDMAIRNYMQSRCPFNHMTVVLRKDLVDKAGGYRHWPQNEDYDLWIRMNKAGVGFANLPETLVNVRVNSALYARRGSLTYFKSELGIQQEMLKEGLISPFCFGVNVVIRFVLQVVMPNGARSFVYRKLARR